jgi:hypothetical protein
MMHPPIASLLLSLSLTASLALCPAFATPSAADPQVEELGERVDEPIDESAIHPQLEELSNDLDQRLGQRVDELLDELATAALEQQVGEIASRRMQRVAKVRFDDRLTPCAGWQNTAMPCLVVTARSQAPANGDFSTATP